MIHKLTQAEIMENQLKGLCYNCDEKYFLEHKCKDQNIFMEICNDEAEVIPLETLHPSIKDIPPYNLHDVDPQIYLHALIGNFPPQTLKLISCIKHHNIIILIGSGRTLNFIHCHISQETHCDIHVVNNG